MHMEKNSMINKYVTYKSCCLSISHNDWEKFKMIDVILNFSLLYIFLIQNIKEWEFQNFFFTCLPDF